MRFLSLQYYMENNPEISWNAISVQFRFVERQICLYIKFLFLFDISQLSQFSFALGVRGEVFVPLKQVSLSVRGYEYHPVQFLFPSSSQRRTSTPHQLFLADVPPGTTVCVRLLSSGSAHSDRARHVKVWKMSKNKFHGIFDHKRINGC